MSGIPFADSTLVWAGEPKKTIHAFEEGKTVGRLIIGRLSLCGLTRWSKSHSNEGTRKCGQCSILSQQRRGQR